MGALPDCHLIRHRVPHLRALVSPLLGPLVLMALAPAAAAQLGPPPVPAENPITEPKRLLGKALFWDEQLSSDNTVACGTCHIPGFGGSDPRADLLGRDPGLDGVVGTADDKVGSPGLVSTDAAGDYNPHPVFGLERQITSRSASSPIGAAHFFELFWDGRAEGTFFDPETGGVAIANYGALESQAVGPIVSSVEMAYPGRTWDDVREKLERVEPLALASDLNPDLVQILGIAPTYPDLFTLAFGDPAITAKRIGFALATYQRTLNPDQTPWDQWVLGVPGAMTSQQHAGWQAFQNGNLKCAVCHVPPLFSDGSYRNLGLRDIAEDAGRQEVTGEFSDRGKFKTPSLRNAGLRPRFFHNADPTWSNLFLSVFFYNQGGGLFLDNKDPLLAGIVMSPQTAADITEFISGALTDPRVAAELPPFDRPSLASEGTSAPVLVGTGVAGTGGIVPSMIAITPSKAGNREFKLGLGDARGGSRAVLAVRATAPGTVTGGYEHGTWMLAGAPVVLPGSGAGKGYATWTRPIADDPALIGTELWLQWRVEDPQAPRGLARTPWAHVTIF